MLVAKRNFGNDFGRDLVERQFEEILRVGSRIECVFLKVVP